MYKITNKTPHPFDIHTKQGQKVIHAFGELTAEFEPAYLELIRLSFEVEEIQAEEQEQEQEQEAESSADADADAGSDSAEEGAEHAEEVVETATEAPAEEVVEAVSDKSVESEVVLTDAERYQAITGKKPDGRWSEERLAAELEKLEG